MTHGRRIYLRGVALSPFLPSRGSLFLDTALSWERPKKEGKYQ